MVYRNQAQLRIASGGVGARNGSVETRSLDDLAHVYLRERVARGEIARSTGRHYRYSLLMFCRFFGERPVTQLGPAGVARWLESLDGIASASTRQNKFSVAHTFCEWLVKRGHLHRDPFVDLRPPRKGRRVPRALHHDAIAELLATVPDRRAQAIVWLMVGMGCRRAEVATLEIGDWDRFREVLTVRGKGDHERVLPVPEEVAAALTAYLAEYPTRSGPLIRSYSYPTRGLSPSTVGMLMSRWMYDAGIKQGPLDSVSAHALRHTCATDVLDRCGDVTVVQDMLGHQSLTTTQMYVHAASRPRLRVAMAGRTYGSAPAATDGAL
jgi:site-specific recombinase XerD